MKVRSDEAKNKTEIQDTAGRGKRVEEEFKKSEEFYRFLTDQSIMGMQVIQGGRIKYVNHATALITGYTSEEIMNWGPDGYRIVLHPDDLPYVMEQAQKKQTGDLNVVANYTWRIIAKSGEIKWIESFSKTALFEGSPADFVMMIDITKRKQAEEKYRNIFENAEEGIYQSTPEGRFIIVNQSLARMLGYDSPEEIISNVTDIARQLYVNPEDRAKFTVLLEKQSLTRNYEVCFYKKDGSTIWVSLTTRTVRNEKGEILYYEGIAADITDRKESVERLRNALGGTVRAIASMVETRDPYTAGHQRRVSDLARAIATEMGLPGDRVEGLRVAAIIHDIGKLSVPAEMLSKPSKLTKIEFSLIKTHAQSGYDILKDIEFPWPISRMVIEHHERIDGSGYPNGLIGANLLLESRILAVADVVEAMASHRPYRAALGIEPALEEIQKNKGILYDAAVADACVRLFRHKGYKLT
ncbi:MAG: PAS domain S-box protein [Deltaproteobacteria bacterium HGW-Deltaproteobacteria-13]|jgi:PAS domain S-box-containing protein/putative nucleotidyltransferase with HDIG domain|nr:MAG: PAS domain S-box protein [Deltaproteobacteria bacterium HGW-Deltaproteobacteria-13]